MIKKPGYVGNEYIITMAREYIAAGMSPHSIMDIIKYDWSQRIKDYTYTKNVRYTYRDYIYHPIDDNQDDIAYYVYHIGLITKTQLHQALMMLNDDERRVVIDIFFLSKSQKELAIMYDVSSSAITQKKQKILKKLKIYLKK